MIAPPERSDARDQAIDALLPQIPWLGWNFSALRTGLQEAGGNPADAEMLFPGSAADLIEAFCDLADRRMEAAASELAESRLSRRVRAVIALRLTQNRPHKEAIRRALAVLARPGNARIAAACTARTVDAIWHAAGDTAADFSWYTKRATLTAIYAATLLYWLRDQSDEDADTLAFLDRRFAGLGGVSRVRGRFKGLRNRLRGTEAAA